MEFGKMKMNNLIEMYKEITNFITFLEKEKQTIEEEQKEEK